MTSAFDPKSIMKYYFDEWMFVAGTTSVCFTGSENLALSALDKEGATKLYPSNAKDVADINRTRMEAIRNIQTIRSLPSATKSHLMRGMTE